MKANKKLNRDFLYEARRIGDQLLLEADSNENGMCWSTMTMGYNRDISFKRSVDIYSGVSGIVLFFLELHKQTREARYLDAAVKGMQWAIAFCEKNPSDYYAFFTGRMGVCYTLLQMYEFTREERYLEKALTLARPCGNFINSSKKDDLLNGCSGALLGLLHLHAAAGEDWILKTIDMFIRRLVEQAHHGPAGLYWDRTAHYGGGLCGFSHGAAGIGFVFLELGRYFHNTAFYWAAEQAFLYERFFFQKANLANNWPDLRKEISPGEDRREQQKAFPGRDANFFTGGGDLNAWCHGAAGIGLTRLHAYRLLKKKIYKKEFQIAIDKTTLTDVASQNPSPLFILCHGGGGNAELFLDAYQTFKTGKYLSLAESIGVNILNYYKKYRRYLSGFRGAGVLEDKSLFMGNAGIGYFLLRLRDPGGVPTVMAPHIHHPPASPAAVSKSLYPFINISRAEMHHRLLQRDFPRTLAAAAAIMPNPVSDFFNLQRLSPGENNIYSSLPAAFTAFMEKNILQLPEPGKEVLSDIFELESKKRRMDEAGQEHSRLSIKKQIPGQESGNLIAAEQESFLKLILVLDPGSNLFSTQWNWDLSNRDQWRSNLYREKEEESSPLLLNPGPLGIMETPLSHFTYKILYEFQEPRAVEQVIRATIEDFDTLTPEEENMVKEKVIEQIKQALSASVLINGSR